VAAICVWVRDQLESLVDGELETGRAVELRAHLAECGDCRAHHAEATSLPPRLAAVPIPEPPGTLVGDVLHRVSRDRIGPLRLWGPLAVELTLFLATFWYVSGLQGLSLLVQHTASDVGALAGWGVGQADLPAPAAGDVFLLLLCGLLVATTLYHLVLLSRYSPRVYT
jgi:predicted anti-sigma-YlaC factor YlaD